MKDKLIYLAKTIHPMRLTELARFLLRDEAISGKLILLGVALALITTNSPLANDYESFWHTHLSIGIGSWALNLDLREWVSEGLMAFFFLVVGLELKRELVHGELKKIQTAALPFAAAIGGMVVPAVMYALINLGTDTLSGWAIPTATDIALAIGILALLGKRIPASVRIFLLTLAIVDDILAVLVIAIFYNAAISIPMLIIAGCIGLAIVLLGETKYLSMPLFLVAGVGLWLAINASGIHPSIAGAFIGLLAPLSLRGKATSSIAERTEKAIIPFSTLVVVPLFAFANTGIALHASTLNNDATLPIIGGVIIGLVVGKVVGILLASLLLVRLGFARLPAEASWGHIIGVGMLAGIGFTVSIFVTGLAFDNDSYIMIAKIGIFVASALSASIGLFTLRFAKLQS